MNDSTHFNFPEMFQNVKQNIKTVLFPQRRCIRIFSYMKSMELLYYCTKFYGKAILILGCNGCHN